MAKKPRRLRRRSGRVAEANDDVKYFHGLVVPWYLTSKEGQAQSRRRNDQQEGTVTHKLTLTTGRHRVTNI